VHVLSAADSSPVAGALVLAGPSSARTGASGEATVSGSPGQVVRIARIGFAPDSVRIPGEAAGPVRVYIQPVAEIEGMVVAATRSERRIDDDPLRVEVLDREEVEEKLRMTPGDITMMMNETPGLRVQTTSPSLGGANVRVQGLRGRYTQILSDGLPLFGGQTGGLGLLQIPPMDLGGVEVIKGVASALYGGNALGGVINLRSRRPEEEPVAELLLNQTMLHGSDIIGFGSRRFGGSWGASMLGGYHRQIQRDVNEDGWSDLPAYDRAVIRPRLFWESPFGHTMTLTGGFTHEDRQGGIDPASPVFAPQFVEALKTSRYDGGGVGRWVHGANIYSLRGSVALQSHHHQFGTTPEKDRHLSTFAEAAITRLIGKASATLGLAANRDQYRNNDAPTFDFLYTVPAVFGQVTFDVLESVAVTASARVDDHSEYGTQFSPRISTLLRAPAGATVRLSAGEGYFAPTPLTEETEVTGLTPLSPVFDVRAERARTMSGDIGRAFGPVEANVTLFRSVIESPLALVRTTEPMEVFEGKSIRLVSATEPTRTSGLDAVARYEAEPWHLTMSYTFIDAREQDVEAGTRRLVPLTPRHQAGLVAAWESEVTRAGFEVYYTGRQSLADDPYRTESVPYTHVGVLVERRFGSARVFINAENLLGFRMTSHQPLIRGTPGPGGRLTVDAWGPLEGRTANIGVRW
jgi:iron complex outermembrane receptor protein